MDISGIANSANRLVIECDLRPLVGDRFQPTGFSNLGAAEYVRPDGTTMLLVESSQSIANRMEAVCWDDGAKDLITALKGLPYIRITLKDGNTTTSIQEAHRINSERIMVKKSDFYMSFGEELGFKRKKEDLDRAVPIDFGKLYTLLMRYDPNSLIHGVFIEELDGRLRVPRSLTGFIEAEGVTRVHSGGVKFSRVDPSEKKGVGNVPYSRTEYVAERISASFIVDVSQFRAMRLGHDATELLVALSLFKVRSVLDDGMKLRTACDLEPSGDVSVRTRGGDVMILPSTQELSGMVTDLIGRCSEAGLFADPAITELSE